MKIRTGFVSNSSSSSFIVGMKIKPKDAKKTYEHNKQIIEKAMGKDYVKECLEDGGEDIVPTTYKIISYTAVEYGSEESVKILVSNLLDGLGIDKKDIVLKWDE